MSLSRASSIWKGTALSGVGLVVIGLGAFLFDFTSTSGYEFIDDNSDWFLLAIPLGFVIAAVGFVGWLRWYERKVRVKIAAVVFTVPTVVCAAVGAATDANVHGPFFLFFFAVVGAAILALALLLVPGAHPRN